MAVAAAAAAAGNGVVLVGLAIRHSAAGDRRRTYFPLGDRPPTTANETPISFLKLTPTPHPSPNSKLILIISLFYV